MKTPRHDDGISEGELQGHVENIFSSPLKPNRRVHKRVQSRLTVRYRFCDEVNAIEQGVETMDISANGLAFETSKCLPITAQLGIPIEFPSMIGSITTDARIVRVQELEENSRYLVGITFLSLSDASIQAIEAYVQEAGINHILRKAVKQKASDLHLVSSRPPMLRINGALTPMDVPCLTPRGLERMILSMMTDRQRSTLKRISSWISCMSCLKAIVFA